MGLNKFIENQDYHLEIEEIRQTNSKDKFSRIKPSTIQDLLNKQFTEGKPQGWPCGIDRLNPIFRWRRRGGLYGLTAYPQAGKSELLKYMAVQAAKLYGWKTVIFSPEEETDDIIEDLVRTFIGKNTNKTFKNQMLPGEWERGLAFVEEHFLLLEFDGMVDFERLIDEYESIIKSDPKYKIFITDPWNYVAEGSFDQAGDKYLKVALTHMKTFSKRHQVHNIIVEHQNKPKLNNKGEVPKASVHNITGGAMWYKKCDTIIILHSYWTETNQDITVDFETAKSKAQRYNGQRGTRALYFELQTGRYLEYDPREKESDQIGIDWSEPTKTGDEDDDMPF